MSCLISIFELSQSPAVWLTAPSVTHYHHLSHSRLFCTLSFLYPPPFPPSAATHSTVDGAEWHEAFSVVGQRAAVGFPVGVLAPLQDELLALEIMVLKTHPAGKKSGRGKNIRAKMVISTVWNQSEHKSDKWHQTGWEGLLVSLMSADASCRKLWVSYFGFFFLFFCTHAKLKTEFSNSYLQPTGQPSSYVTFPQWVISH